MATLIDRADADSGDCKCRVGDGAVNDDDDGAIVIVVCGGNEAILAAATGVNVTFSIVVSSPPPPPVPRLEDELRGDCFSSSEAVK